MINVKFVINIKNGESFERLYTIAEGKMDFVPSINQTITLNNKQYIVEGVDITLNQVSQISNKFSSYDVCVAVTRNK